MKTEARISLKRENGQTIIDVPPRRHMMIIGVTLLTGAAGVACFFVFVSDLVEFGLGILQNWETLGLFVLGLLLSLSFIFPLWSISGMETLVIGDDRMIRTCKALGWRNEEEFKRESFQEARWVDGDLHDYALLKDNHNKQVSHIRFSSDGVRAEICKGTSREEGKVLLNAMGVDTQKELAS